LQGPDAVPCWAGNDYPLRGAGPARAVLLEDGTQQGGCTQTELLCISSHSRRGSGVRTVIGYRLRPGGGISVEHGHVHSLRAPGAGSGGKQDSVGAGLTGRVCAACTPWVRPLVESRRELALSWQASCIPSACQTTTMLSVCSTVRPDRQPGCCSTARRWPPPEAPAGSHKREMDAAAEPAGVIQNHTRRSAAWRSCAPMRTTSVPPAVYAAGTPRWAGRDRAMADAAGCERGGPCGGPAGSRRAGTAVARVARGRG